MDNYTHALTDSSFHSKLQTYLYNRLNSMLQTTSNMDHLQMMDLMEQDLSCFDDFENSIMVAQKINRFKDWLHINRQQHVDWFGLLEFELQKPHVVGQPLIGKLQITNVYRTNISWENIECKFISKPALRKILKIAREFAYNDIRREGRPANGYDTGYVLSAYFHDYINTYLNTYKRHCSTILKTLHQTAIQNSSARTTYSDTSNELDMSTVSNNMLTERQQRHENHISFMRDITELLEIVRLQNVPHVFNLIQTPVTPPVQTFPIPPQSTLAKNYLKCLANTPDGLGQCPICYEDLEEATTVVPECSHLLCNTCCTRINKCPICRNDL